ncbi:hypothetical protein [Streptomyces sp. PSKA30]
MGRRTAKGVRAGPMTGARACQLEKLVMAWSVADEQFWENLEAARA